MYDEEFAPTRGAMPHGTGPDTMKEGIGVVRGRVDVAALEALQDVDPRQPVFPHARDLRALQIRKSDLVVTPDEGDEPLGCGDPTALLVRSAFNGDGKEERAAFPNRPDLWIPALLAGVRFAGVANEPKVIPDVGVHADHAGNTMVGCIVAGKVTLQARESVYPGATMYATLPDPGERQTRYPASTVEDCKLQARVKSPETVWRSFSRLLARASVENQTKAADSRFSPARKVDPGLDLFESLGDAAVVFLLLGLKALVHHDVIRVSAGANRAFDVRADATAPLEGVPLVLALAKGFGVVPPEVPLEGATFTRAKYSAYHDLRRLLVAQAAFDGTYKQHAFHDGVDAEPWYSDGSRRTPAQRVTEAQVNCLRDLVAAVDGANRAASKWEIGTALGGGVKDGPFTMMLR
jgi:hypothetical protein